MKSMFIVVLFVSVVAEAFAFYNPQTGRWLSRDPVDEPGAHTSYRVEDQEGPYEFEDLNPYGFVINDPISLTDSFGLAIAGTPADDAPRDCACKCIDVAVTFTPGGNSFTPDMHQYPSGDWWFGTVITIAWKVDGDPTKCRYFYKEKDGGVWGSGPRGKKSRSSGTPNEDWFEVGQVHNDATGWLAEGPGKYIIKYNLTQTYKCVSADPTDVVIVGPKKYKKRVKKIWP
jgi:RHS repeat-associated protein